MLSEVNFDLYFSTAMQLKIYEQEFYFSILTRNHYKILFLL